MEELGLGTIIKFAIFLLFAVILIVIARTAGYDSVQSFLGIFSLAPSCDGQSAKSYEHLITGYAKEHELVQQFEVCDRYRRCFSQEFELFEQKNAQAAKRLCGVSA